ncbi:hypothetical protein BUALT_Bualt12G0091300 [Buddleja alternifolia]|uniref:Prolamin-like domain-containing protein n=1 Tax=Buddleja alternifolia TaxID=168488 RepID=A0AAV6X0I1_9LAMI|nr:hypothetical protein BUALT_Bualt12G0091300 [Buddleja alternifolia]
METGMESGGEVSKTEAEAEDKYTSRFDICEVGWRRTADCGVFGVIETSEAGIATALNIPNLSNGIGGLGFLPGFGGTSPPSTIGGLPEITGCLTAVTSVPGCAEELLSSVLTLQIQLLSPSCCGALLQVEENCWPKIFPLNPLFPSTLKTFCTSVQALPVAPTPP